MLNYSKSLYHLNPQGLSAAETKTAPAAFGFVGGDIFGSKVKTNLQMSSSELIP